MSLGQSGFEIEPRASGTTKPPQAESGQPRGGQSKRGNPERSGGQGSPRGGRCPQGNPQGEPFGAEGGVRAAVVSSPGRRGKPEGRRRVVGTVPRFRARASLRDPPPSQSAGQGTTEECPGPRRPKRTPEAAAKVAVEPETKQQRSEGGFGGGSRRRQIGNYAKQLGKRRNSLCKWVCIGSRGWFAQANQPLRRRFPLKKWFSIWRRSDGRAHEMATRVEPRNQNRRRRPG